MQLKHFVNMLCPNKKHGKFSWRIVFRRCTLSKVKMGSFFSIGHPAQLYKILRAPIVLMAELGRGGEYAKTQFFCLNWGHLK